MTARPRALVVEDERAWQNILGEILAEAGLEVDVAATAEEAIRSLRSMPHRLAVVDLSLGGDHTNQDGLRVLDAVRCLDPGCQALLLTGYATVEIAVSALTEHGALTCLRKEAFRRAELRALVQRVLASAVPAATLPLAANVPVEGAEGRSAREMLPAGRALVVDDDAGWRSILTELLQELGYRVRACAGYGEARGCLRRAHYDLAVVDLSLPGVRGPDDRLEGYRLLDAARMAAIPALVVTGAATAEEIERAYSEHGVFACLEKQAFDRRAFLQTVQEARTTGPKPGDLAILTQREREVLALLARGATNRHIAETLVITQNTVKRHLKAIFEKLGVHTRAAAAARAISLGLPGRAVEMTRDS